VELAKVLQDANNQEESFWNNKVEEMDGEDMDEIVLPSRKSSLGYEE
jgi:hypothetical protein